MTAQRKLLFGGWQSVRKKREGAGADERDCRSGDDGTRGRKGRTGDTFPLRQLTVPIEVRLPNSSRNESELQGAAKCDVISSGKRAPRLETISKVAPEFWSSIFGVTEYVDRAHNNYGEAFEELCMTARARRGQRLCQVMP